MACIPPHLREQILLHPASVGSSATSTNPRLGLIPISAQPALHTGHDRGEPRPGSRNSIEQARSDEKLDWDRKSALSSSYVHTRTCEVPQDQGWGEKLDFGRDYEAGTSDSRMAERSRASRTRIIGRSIIVLVASLCAFLQFWALVAPQFTTSTDRTAPLSPSFIEHCTSSLIAPSGTYIDRIHALGKVLPEQTVWIAEPGPSASYFLGRFTISDWFLSERPFLIAIEPSGNITLLTPAFEALRASLITLPHEVAERTRFVEWREDENPYSVLKECLGRVEFVLDGQVREFVGDGLQERLVERKDKEVKEKIGLIRERKDEREIELLKCANQFTLHAIRKTREKMYFGITESQTSKILKEEMAATGLKGGEGLVLFGENAALPHGSGTDRVLGKHDFILIDAGGKWGDYISDITRTFALPKSKIPQAHIDLWETVRQAQYAPYSLLGNSTTSSSLRFGQLDQAARQIISSKYSASASALPDSLAMDAAANRQSRPDLSVFTHRLGHGIGLEGHEAPYLVQGPLGEKEVKPGHTFSLEPGIYLPLDRPEVRGLKGVGVRLEDCFVVREDGEGRLGGEWLSGPVGEWGDI